MALPRVLPLFPLPVVLLPGAVMPLHLFEPRYRRLLGDCLAGERRFGLVHLPPGTEERALPAGQVGCVATIEHAEPLADGRSNILVRGGERFAFARFATSEAPYHVGEVVPFDDEPEPHLAVALVADEVRMLFARVVRSLRAADGGSATPPPLPEEPDAVAFAIGALIDLDADGRQRLLASRSAIGRLRTLQQLLARAAETLELRRAVEHRRDDPSLELGA